MSSCSYCAKLVTLVGLVSFLIGCGGNQDSTIVLVDGSSTVFPISEAAAEEYGKINQQHRVTVGISGTGGGFKKFGAGEVHIVGASRPITPSEVELCRKNEIEYIELPVAYDGICIVVHPSNDWVDYLTVAELRRVWKPSAQGTVLHWQDIRPEWPDHELHLYGAGVNSGTFDYFTAAIVGEEHSSRGDFTSSEDDNVLVQGVATDDLAMGFFGFAYYEENSNKLRAVPIEDENPDNGAGPIEPTSQTIGNMTYQPLSRPIFIYVNKAALDLGAVSEFVSFYLSSAKELVPSVGFIPLSDSAYTLAQNRVDSRIVGSIFGGMGSQVGVDLEELLKTGLNR